MDLIARKIGNGIARMLESRGLWISLGLVLLWSGGQRAVRTLARDPRFLAEPAALDAQGPKSASQMVAQPALDRIRALGPVNLFDPAFERKIRDALDEVPGVRAVPRIRKQWPNRYAVSIRFHRPVAVVEWEDRIIPVTVEGVALPLAPYRPAARRLMRITGVATEPPELGSRWADEDLFDGLAALGQIRPYLAELAPLGIEEIDVAGSADPRRGVCLRAKDGTVVRWGRPRADVGENGVEKKMTHLRIAAKHLDQVRGLEIDVRYGVLYLRQSPAQ